MKELLTEIDSLKERLTNSRPFPAEALKKINEALEIEYTYESNKIEGNTLTLMETALVISEGVTISGKPLREHLEAINHAQAIEFIKDIAAKREPINERTIKDIHSIVLHGIDKENAGKYRSVNVMISGSKHVPAQHYLLNEQMEAFMNEFKNMEKNSIHPLLISAFLHEKLVTIHPFIDGNGRTARLLMNLYLLSNGYTIVNLKGEQEQKTLYYKALEKAQVENDIMDFNLLVARAEKESLEKYITILGIE